MKQKKSRSRKRERERERKNGIKGKEGWERKNQSHRFLESKEYGSFRG